MLEIGLNTRTLYLNGEKIPVSRELADWVAKYTSVAVTFKIKGDD
jgi:hypothetical protein